MIVLMGPNGGCPCVLGGGRERVGRGGGQALGPGAQPKLLQCALQS